MNRHIPLLLLAALLALPAGAADSTCDAVTLGTGINLAETTPIDQLLADAEARVGQPVAVEGEVTEVCQMAGCWLELRAGEGDRSIRVKVDDGVLVFPNWAQGKRARAEGTVERLELAREEYVVHRQHEAHEADRDFDESEVEGDGPFLVYRIRGTGAEICR
jgi:hypothetical protein